VPDALKPLPLSHPIRVEGIKPRGTVVVVTASEAQRAPIAAMLGLDAVERLEARYELARNGERVKLEGAIKAAVRQICVVTLEAFPVELDVPLKLDFAPEAPEPSPRRRGDPGDETEIDIEVRLNEDDPPEPIIDGVIDLGAVTLEFLALALDPYPRKPGVSFDAPAADTPSQSPFAALAKLKP
jgi:uncharacterized metal-binding protein YceD (DUF177 family)